MRSVLAGGRTMPIHDWPRVDAGLFHHFHQSWINHLSETLNAGRLPPGYFALAEQFAKDAYPDVLTLERGERWDNQNEGGVALLETPPRTRFHSRAVVDGYAERANRIVIRHRWGDIVASIEIVSPGNKASRANLDKFVEKTLRFIENGVHVLVIDLFPPSKRDPQGIHQVIWDHILEEPFELPRDKPLTLASYSAGEEKSAYVEPVAAGDLLPDMPLFLEPDRHIPAPLELSYMEAWTKCPEPFKQAVLGKLAPRNPSSNP